MVSRVATLAIASKTAISPDGRVRAGSVPVSPASAWRWSSSSSRAARRAVCRSASWCSRPRTLRQLGCRSPRSPMVPSASITWSLVGQGVGVVVAMCSLLLRGVGVLLAPEARHVVQGLDGGPLAAGQLGHQVGVAGPERGADPPALEGVREVVELVEGVAVRLATDQAGQVGDTLEGQAGEVGAARELALLRQVLGVAVGLGRLGDDPAGHRLLPSLGVKALPVPRAAPLKLAVAWPAAERAWAGPVAAVLDSAVARGTERPAEVHDDGLTAAGAELALLGRALGLLDLAGEVGLSLVGG